MQALDAAGNELAIWAVINQPNPLSRGSKREMLVTASNPASELLSGIAWRYGRKRFEASWSGPTGGVVPHNANGCLAHCG